MPDVGTQKTKTKRYQSCSCNSNAPACKGMCLCSKRNKSPASTALEGIMSNVITTAADKGKALSYWTIEDVVPEANTIRENKNALIISINTPAETGNTLEDMIPEVSTFGENRNPANYNRTKSPSSTALIISINTTAETCNTLEDMVPEASTIEEKRNTASYKESKSLTSAALEYLTSHGINSPAETCKTLEDMAPEVNTFEESRESAKAANETAISNQASSLRALIDRIKDITVKTFDMTALVSEDAPTDQATTVEATNHLANEKYVGSYLKNVVRKALLICSKRDKAICTDTGRHIIWRAACIGAKKDQVICASLLNKIVDKAARIGANKNKTVIKVDDKTDAVDEVKTICTNAAKLVVSKAIYFGAQRITGICSSLIRDLELDAINSSARKHIIWKAAVKRTNKGSYKAMRPLYLSKEKLDAVDKNIIINDSSFRQLVCVATCISQDTAITGAVKTLVDNAIDSSVDNAIDSSVDNETVACLGAVKDAVNAAIDICAQTCEGTCSEVVNAIRNEAVDICLDDVEYQDCSCDDSNFAPPEERKKIVCPATGGECPFKPNRNLETLPVVVDEEPICPCPKKVVKKAVDNTVVAKIVCPATGGVCPFKSKRESRVKPTEECYCIQEENPTESCEETCPNRTPKSVCPSTGGDCPKRKKKKVKTGRKKDTSVGTCPTTGGLCPYVKRLRQLKGKSKGDEICPPTCTARRKPDQVEKSSEFMETSNVPEKICAACPDPCGEFCPDD